MAELDSKTKSSRVWIIVLALGAVVAAVWMYWRRNTIGVAEFLTTLQFEGLQLTAAKPLLDTHLYNFSTNGKKAELTFTDGGSGRRGSFSMRFDGHGYDGGWNLSGPFVNMWFDARDGAPFGGSLSFRPPRYVDD